MLKAFGPELRAFKHETTERGNGAASRWRLQNVNGAENSLRHVTVPSREEAPEVQAKAGVATAALHFKP
jgi:hypothetical protein